MDRRRFFQTSAGSGSLVLFAATMGQTAHADTSTVSQADLEQDPLAFVEDGMLTNEVAEALFDGQPQEREAYLAAASKYPGLAPREQLRSVLASGDESGTSDAQVAPAAVPVVLAVAGRALLAAVRRYGPAMYRSLRDAVTRGYSAFNQWTKDNPFVAGIIGGVGSAELHRWLTENM